MRRTISVEVGKGSVNHNSRKFKAENIDAERSLLNVDYCNENIKQVYRELFDEALKRYDEKQTRSNRKIKNYYEKIRSGNQEKPFHEIILQVGNKDDMSAIGENAELAKTILDEYYQGFQERNPSLRVFSAHLHMDEVTPHIHIDFVPFTTGSKRGLETRVSLKQALAAQGFKGGTRGNTEWNQWVQAEKEVLASVMARHGVEWEQKGTHNKHLSVLDYKKQERVKEIEQLDSILADKKDQRKSLSEQIENYVDGKKRLDIVTETIENDPEYQLQEPNALMSTKAYKTKIVEPLVAKLKSLVKSAMVSCIHAWDNYHRLNVTNGNLYRENERLQKVNEKLSAENTELKSQNKDFRLLRKVFGSRQIDNLIAQAKEQTEQKMRQKRTKNIRNER